MQKQLLCEPYCSFYGQRERMELLRKRKASHSLSKGWRGASSQGQSILMLRTWGTTAQAALEEVREEVLKGTERCHPSNNTAYYEYL